MREMRRKNQQLPMDESIEILEKSSSGVLAVSGDGGYPYAVPMSYVWFDGKIYFHSATQGHKVDAVRSCDKASFCIISEDEVVAETFSTNYKSVIVFGKVSIVEDAAEKRAAIEALAKKYSIEHMAKGYEEINTEWDRFYMIALTPEHISGKEARALMMQRKKAKTE